MATKAELAKDLERAVMALDRVCEVVANEEYSYPEKAGRIAVTASMALDKLGHTKWSKHFEEAYSSRNPRQPIGFPTPLLKVA